MLPALVGSGAVRTQKRIDYAPLCATVYNAGAADAGAPEQNYLVGTQGGVVLVYRDMELMWSARLAAPATALRVGIFGCTSGLILSLGHDGAVSLVFL